MWWPLWLTGIRSWQSIIVNENVACSPSRQSVPWKGSHWQRRWRQPQPSLLVSGSVLAASKRSLRCCAPQSAPALSLHHLSPQFAMPVTVHHSRNNYGQHTSLICRSCYSLNRHTLQPDLHSLLQQKQTCTFSESSWPTRLDPVICFTSLEGRNRLAHNSLFLPSRLVKQITGSRRVGQLLSENDLNWHNLKQNEAQSAHAESTRKGVD